MPESPHHKKLPPLDWLRVFEAAGRHQNFTLAAGELNLTQAAVSQRIKSLENWLGRPLFSRKARGVALTVDGESYLPLVVETLQKLDQGTQDLFGKTPREIRLAALSSHMDTLVLPRLSGFLERHSRLRLVLDSVPLRSAFDAGGTALQVRYGRGVWPDREAALLHLETLRPMVAGGQCVANWAEQPAIVVRGERPGWREWSRHTGCPAPRCGQISVDSMGHGLRAARLGYGVVLGSGVLAVQLLRSGQLTLTDAPALSCDDGYWLTWPKPFARSKDRTRLVADLTEALQSG